MEYVKNLLIWLIVTSSSYKFFVKTLGDPKIQDQPGPEFLTAKFQKSALFVLGRT